MSQRIDSELKKLELAPKEIRVGQALYQELQADNNIKVRTVTTQNGIFAAPLVGLNEKAPLTNQMV